MTWMMQRGTRMMTGKPGYFLINQPAVSVHPGLALHKLETRENGRKNDQ